MRTEFYVWRKLDYILQHLSCICWTYSISAASIIAKVTRDRMMEDYHQKYPQYNFAKHKGYGTKEHLRAIQEHGICELHRKTFRGVREHVR